MLSSKESQERGLSASGRTLISIYHNILYLIVNIGNRIYRLSEDSKSLYNHYYLSNYEHVKFKRKPREGDIR